MIAPTPIGYAIAQTQTAGLASELPPNVCLAIVPSVLAIAQTLTVPGTSLCNGSAPVFMRLLYFAVLGSVLHETDQPVQLRRNQPCRCLSCDCAALLPISLAIAQTPTAGFAIAQTPTVLLPFL